MKGFSALLADPVSVVDGERTDDVFPALDLVGHVLPVVAAGGRHEVEHVHGGLLVGEMPAVTDLLAEPGVQRRR